MKVGISVYTDRLTVKMEAETPAEGYYLHSLKRLGADVRVRQVVPTGECVHAAFSVPLDEIRPGDCRHCGGGLDRGARCTNDECDRHGEPAFRSVTA